MATVPDSIMHGNPYDGAWNRVEAQWYRQTGRGLPPQQAKQRPGAVGFRSGSGSSLGSSGSGGDGGRRRR